MNIVGLGGSVHDFATCLLAADDHVYAIEDERLTRVRHALNSSNPCQPSLDYCLRLGGLRLDDIDTVVGNDMLQHVPSRIAPKIVLLNHHLTHVYSTFFTSPFDEAAILVVDGAGSVVSNGSRFHERETTTYAWGQKNHVSTIGRVVGSKRGPSFTNDVSALMSNSLGDFYRAITESIGFGFLQAGKTMGLAPYGDNRYVAQLMKFVKLLPGGQFEIEIEGKSGLLQALRQLRQKAGDTQERFEVDAAIAFAGQAVLENVLVHALDFLYSKTKTPNLCLAGGVALNSLLNGKIPVLSKFKNVHVFFAPGDSGTAVGAAIYGLLHSSKLRAERLRIHAGPYWGREYSLDELAASLERFGLPYSRPPDLERKVVHLLDAGATVAWFQGGSEFGPRALGNRSILADPRSRSMKDQLNLRVKSREWFQPYGPAVTDSAATDYFDMLCPSPWMQFVWRVRDEVCTLLPAITHVDGSSRIQSVKASDNNRFHSLLREFQDVTGFPVLVNTSFNTRGCPIVESPTHAIDVFMNTELDALALDEFLVIKR